MTHNQLTIDGYLLVKFREGYRIYDPVTLRAVGSDEVRCPHCGKKALVSPSKGLWCPNCMSGRAIARAKVEA